MISLKKKWIFPLAVNYRLFSHGDVSYRFNGKNDNVVLEFRISLNQPNNGYPKIDFKNILKSNYGYPKFSMILFIQNVFKDIQSVFKDYQKCI